jgi:hypothetical protein
MVEFAIVVSIFLALLFVTIDFGMAFRTKLIIDNGVQAAARVGAGVGNNIDVDLYVLDEFLDGLAALPNGGGDVLVFVEVYKVRPDGTPDPVNTNTYFYDPDPTDCDWNPCPKGSTGSVPNKPAWDTYPDEYVGWDWTPDERSVVFGNLDEIGVRAHYSHAFLTGFMPGTAPACDTPLTAPTNCWTEDTILRLEPLQFSASG